MTEEDKLNEKLKDLGESLQAMQLPTTSNNGRGTDIEALLNTGERLLRRQQDRLVGEKANYEAERTNTLNAYAANLAKLERDTADVLHQLAVQHQAKVTEIERLITKLKALREA